MMTEPHLHCGECGCVIEAFVCDSGNGEPTPALIHSGQQGFVMPSPEGLKFGMRKVPLCDECFACIESQSPWIVVPGRPNLRPV
jgi:hypothetical protein